MLNVMWCITLKLLDGVLLPVMVSHHTQEVLIVQLLLVPLSVESSVNFVWLSSSVWNLSPVFHPSIHSLALPSMNDPSIHPSLRHSFHPFIPLFTDPSVHLSSTHFYALPSFHLFIHTPIHLCVYPFIHLSFYSSHLPWCLPFIHPSVYPFIHSPIHSSTHGFSHNWRPVKTIQVQILEDGDWIPGRRWLSQPVKAEIE